MEATRRTINGVEFEFNHLSVRILNRLLVRIAKIAGEPLADAIDDKILKTVRTDMEAAKKQVNIKAIVKSLATSLDEDVVDQLITDLLQGTICVGVGPLTYNFEKAFNGDVGFMWKVVYTAFTVYYGTFLADGLDSLN